MAKRLAFALAPLLVLAMMQAPAAADIVQTRSSEPLKDMQPVDHFSMIFAFYVHALPDKPETYDSFHRGTFLRQRELIHYYNPDIAGLSLSACPQ